MVVVCCVLFVARWAAHAKNEKTMSKTLPPISPQQQKRSKNWLALFRTMELAIVCDNFFASKWNSFGGGGVFRVKAPVA